MRSSTSTAKMNEDGRKIRTLTLAFEVSSKRVCECSGFPKRGSDREKASVLEVCREAAHSLKRPVVALLSLASYAEGCSYGPRSRVRRIP